MGLQEWLGSTGADLRHLFEVVDPALADLDAVASALLLTGDPSWIPIGCARRPLEDGGGSVTVRLVFPPESRSSWKIEVYDETAPSTKAIVLLDPKAALPGGGLIECHDAWAKLHVLLGLRLEPRS